MPRAAVAEEAVRAGADELINACQLCIKNFSDAKQKYAIPVGRIDLAELVARSIV